ncbi:hypothetical protein [Thermoflexus sp.]|uniref:hypothetical protein n=1 Tax=Thermoflexus sp. TaxID=1969742 RepID=UPI0035E46174
MAWHWFQAARSEIQTTRPGRESVDLAAPVWSTEIGVPLIVGLMMTGGWLTLEWFNYSASQYAMTTLFGDLMADGMTWGTLLALGLWLVDLSGLIYLSIPNEREKPGFWYVLVAWLLASGANALLKWWAVTLALMASPLAQPATPRAAFIHTLMPYIPTATAFLVWTGRVLLISTIMGLLMPALHRLTGRLHAWADSRIAQTSEGTEEVEATSPGPRLITPNDREALSRRRIGQR